MAAKELWSSHLPFSQSSQLLRRSRRTSLHSSSLGCWWVWEGVARSVLLGGSARISIIILSIGGGVWRFSWYVAPLTFHLLKEYPNQRMTGSNNIRTHPRSPNIRLHQRSILELGLLDRSHTCWSDMAALLLLRRNIRSHDPKAARKATTQGDG